jgi:CubicO group peptidase (beta-lactamase class C family)
VFDPTDVLDDPAPLGIDPGRLSDLIDRARKEIDEGLLPSCQLAVARNGRLAAFHTWGDASNATRYVIFSCTKALVASAAWLLIDEGRLDPASKVADLIPEFATNGKDVVTVEQVMLHTSGFPHAPMAPALWNDRDARIRRFADWRLNWEPGTAFEYHATSAHWVLAELIERLSGRDFRAFIRERIVLPLGLPRFGLGVPLDDQHDIATLVTVGEPPSPDELEALFGIRQLPVTEVTDHALIEFNSPDARRAGVPGGGAITTAADLALFYQALLLNPGEMWRPATLHDVTTNVRNRFNDPWTGVPANRTLGLVLAGDDGKSNMRMHFGRTVSPGAFGHAGAGGQVAWADPATGLSFCYLTNGLDANLLRQGRRGNGLSSRAAALCSA